MATGIMMSVECCKLHATPAFKSSEQYAVADMEEIDGLACSLWRKAPVQPGGVSICPL